MNKPIQLLEGISSYDFLQIAWKSLNKTNKKSRGISSTTIKDFSNNLEFNLKQISQQLLEGSYSFSPVRGVALEKKNSKKNSEEKDYRPLRIGEINDRIVQKALAIKLDGILSYRFTLDNECSFAYRKGKNVQDAISRMIEYYQEGYTIILEADIEKFFDNVDKENLLKLIEGCLPDESCNSLIRFAVSQKVGNIDSIDQKIFERYFQETENGIPQGNSLSPLFANIYLASFDRRMITEGFKMIRYADDFIIMCKNMNDAQTALKIAKEELEDKLGLRVHDLGLANSEEAKTKIVNPRKDKFSFLSIRFDGTRCWVVDKKYESIKQKILNITNVGELRQKSAFEGLLPLLTSLRNTIEGWIVAYHFVDLDGQLKELDKHINRQLYLAFKELKFDIQKKSLEQISFKGRSNKILALSRYQRANIGIPSCLATWNRIRK
jgi:RNA-directed DNA polymerase